VLLDRAHHPAPADLPQAGEGHDHGPGGEEDVLHVVRDDERDHPSERGVGEGDHEERGHRPAEVLARDAGDDGEEAGLDDREDAEVQRAADRHQDAGEHAHPAAVAALEVLGDGEDAQLAQARDHEAGAADQQAHAERDDADHEGREPGHEAELRLVHVGDDPHLGGEQRRGAHVEAHAPVRHEVVLDRPDVPLHAEADPEGGQEGEDGDRPVEEGEGRDDGGRAHGVRISSGTSWRQGLARDRVRHVETRTTYAPGA
jgi:hypothetical protein